MIKSFFSEKKTSKRILLALASIMLLASFFIWQMYLLPQKATIISLKSACSLERQNLSNISLFARTYPESETYLAELDEKLAVLEDLLPDSPQISNFLLETEDTSKMAGVAILEARLLPEVAQDKYKEFPIEMTIKGSFEEITDFYEKLAASRRFVSIVSSTISINESNQDDKSRPELENKITLVIYAQI